MLNENIDLIHRGHINLNEIIWPDSIAKTQPNHRSEMSPVIPYVCFHSTQLAAQQTRTIHGLVSQQTRAL